MSEETMDFSASAVLKRMRDSLQNPVNKIEGGFSMDNLQAVAEEMARMDAMEVQPIPDHVLLDTAEGEYLDRKALDYNETRNPAAASVGNLLFTGEPGTVIPLGTEVMVMMFTTAFALSPDFRASALNLLITFEEQYTQLTMNGNATGGNTSQTENSAPYDFTATYFEHLEVGWIPEGFTCTRNDYDSSALFEDSAGQFFSINRADGHGTLNVDTEDADSVVNITVNGINGIQVLKDGRIHSVLSDLEHGLFIQLRTSSGISTEIHQRILENIKYIA